MTEPTHVAKISRLQWQYAHVPITVEPGQDPEEAAAWIDEDALPADAWHDGDQEGAAYVDDVEPYKEQP